MHLILFPFKLLLKPQIFILLFSVSLVFGSGWGYQFFKDQKETRLLENKINSLSINDNNLKTQFANVQKELTLLKTSDQVKKNTELEQAIKNIETTYQKSLGTYEKILDYKGNSTTKTKFDTQYAQSLKYLSERNYASASTLLEKIENQITQDQQKAATVFKIPENVKESATPPSSGYSKQKVKIDLGEFIVDIISADLNSTKVVVDTASDSDCANNCPVLNLSDYVARSGAFAGINGSFFCPATYPNCQGKTNSYDTLLMNKQKYYFNSDNNVYSNVPAVIFSGNSARFVTRSLEWGRDTNVDSVLANYPLYILNGQVMFSTNGDPKIDSVGARTFVGATNTTVYIGIVHNATAGQAAKVLQSMGIQSAIGLDQGGSTALWFGGYKAGPGRGIPNALLLVKK